MARKTKVPRRPQRGKSLKKAAKKAVRVYQKYSLGNAIKMGVDYYMKTGSPRGSGGYIDTRRSGRKLKYNSTEGAWVEPSELDKLLKPVPGSPASKGKKKRTPRG